MAEVIRYRLPDGRSVAFGDPQAIADRIRKLRAWNAAQAEEATEPCPYCDVWRKPSTMAWHIRVHHQRETGRGRWAR